MKQNSEGRTGQSVSCLTPDDKKDIKLRNKTTYLKQDVCLVTLSIAYLRLISKHVARSRGLI